MTTSTTDSIVILRRKDGAYVIAYASPSGFRGILAVAGSRLTAFASALTFALALGVDLSKGGF